MAKKRLLMQLRKERAKLIGIANKQLVAKRKVDTAKMEESRLRNQIKALKIRTGKDVFSRVRRARKKIQSSSTSPETKQRLKKGIRKAKSAFSKFQDFADRFGTKL